jgi:predicted enzyme related to lactoylglutathione lyase
VTQVATLTFACEDPERMAAFWAQALGYVAAEVPVRVPATWLDEGPGADEASALADPDGQGLRLVFDRAERTPPTAIPLHLQLSADDRTKEVARLVELGATVVRTTSHRVGESLETRTVMRDPEGNGFSIQGPGA